MKSILLISSFIVAALALSFNINYKVISIIDSTPQSIKLQSEFISQEERSIFTEALAITKDNLSFSLNSKGNSNVNYINKTKVAHCVGYTNYYNAVLFEILKTNHISANYKIQHARAKVIIGGIDLTGISTDPAFKDHDISVITNKKTGEIYYIDPSLSEVLGNIITKK